MKLNYECLRKTLMALEETLSLDDTYDFKRVGIHEIVGYPVLSNDFDKKEIAYCVHMLADAGLLETVSETLLRREIEVTTLTYKGHEFLEQIRNDNTWEKTLNVLKSVGVFTINMISQVAAEIISKKLQ